MEFLDEKEGRAESAWSGAGGMIEG